jgi:class 3 adenylate cyclase/tetratricopeptide (TPR) repeat protein
MLALGDPLAAREIALAAFNVAVPPGSPDPDHRIWRSDVELRQIYGLALARSANSGEALRVLQELHREGNADVETLGMLGRVYKDLAWQESDEGQREGLFRQSVGYYEEAYREHGSYWTGINVATLARLRGDERRARQVAEDVRRQCRAELDKQPAPARARKDLYWPLATLGEAALVLGDLDEAGRLYRQAYEAAPKEFGHLNSTRGHARRLLEHSGSDAALLDGWLPVPKVVIFAGHMIDQPGRRSERFPARCAEAVKAAIKVWLAEQHALIGFSSAACGSDILFQEALHESGGEAHVVLPYGQAAFVADSVDIIPGENWSERFQQVLERATSTITVSRQKMSAGGISYDYADRVVQGLASVRAQQLETDLLGLAVWNGQPGDEPGGTATNVRRWHAAGVPVHRVDLSRPPGPGAVPGVVVDRPRGEIAASDDLYGRDLRVMYILFGDAVRFSDLTEDEVPLFVEHYLGLIAELLDTKYPQTNVVRNTWGDGLYLVFDNLRDAGCCALDLIDAIKGRTWCDLGFHKELTVRLALHAGPLFRCHDPVIRQMNYTGTHSSRAARLEPRTPPGEVYATEAFAALAAIQNVTEFACRYVKQLQWDKHYGTFPTYVVQRAARDSRTMLKQA